jgi:hypothetical protein
VNGQPEQLTVIALNSAIGVAAISSSVGLAVVDILSASLIYFSLTSDLSNCDPASFPPLQIEAKNDISPPLEVNSFIF